MEAFESIKTIHVNFNKPKGKLESYFVTNKKSKSWVICDKRPKIKTVTSPKMISFSTLDE